VSDAEPVGFMHGEVCKHCGKPIAWWGGFWSYRDGSDSGHKPEPSEKVAAVTKERP